MGGILGIKEHLNQNGVIPQIADTLGSTLSPHLIRGPYFFTYGGPMRRICPGGHTESHLPAPRSEHLSPEFIRARLEPGSSTPPPPPGPPFRWVSPTLFLPCQTSANKQEQDKKSDD